MDTPLTIVFKNASVAGLWNKQHKGILAGCFTSAGMFSNGSFIYKIRLLDQADVSFLARGTLPGVLVSVPASIDDKVAPCPPRNELPLSTR